MKKPIPTLTARTFKEIQEENPLQETLADLRTSIKTEDGQVKYFSRTDKQSESNFHELKKGYLIEAYEFLKEKYGVKN